ncbi:MAG TPA: PHP domain-containing protein [Solirubrobacteraceae bacterium]|nr:PHP domain-containing protein [Solirubrobacteraceae bacterium]
MPAQPSFDLQAHSVHSDGSLPAAEVVERAAAAGVELFALTDHDTVDGVPEAQAKARELGLRFSPAAELSAVHGGHEDLHILGYELDVADRHLVAILEDYRGDRARRIEAMADRLRALGFELDDAPLVARRDAGKPIGRPHLADAVLAHPGNAQRLADEGIHGRDELFPPYLVPGAKAYVARSRPTVAEAIEVIHAAGGVAVWAHPFWDVDAPDEAIATLETFVAAGLDGVECFYVTHTEAQTRLLHDVATRHGLLTTGSTDFHGPDHGRFSAFCEFDVHGLTVELGPIGSKTG